MVKRRQLGIYLHLPWCSKKCPYCDFNSHSLRGVLPEERYVAALLADLDQDLHILERPVRGTSLFIGGGTPSLFSPPAIEALIAGVADRVDLATDAEITLEANPGSSDRARFQGFRASGVNRLSIGVQSFCDQSLKALGRVHDAEQAKAALAAAQRAGFERLNVDLMYGLPEQSVAQAVADIDAAVSLEVTHVSHYQLTLEPNTVFYRRPPPLPSEQAIEDMEVICREQLEAAGLRRYEIAAFAAPGAECQHNLNYWRFGDYLGLGAGAHGKVTRPGGQQLRLAKVSHPQSYLDRASSPSRIADRRELHEQDRVFEFMLNRTRLMEGFSDQEFERATGVAPSVPRSALAKLVNQGLMSRSEGHWRVTGRGHRFLNDLQREFLPADPTPG